MIQIKLLLREIVMFFNSGDKTKAVLLQTVKQGCENREGREVSALLKEFPQEQPVRGRREKVRLHSRDRQ